MANYIVTKNKEYFEKIGNYNYCSLQDMVLPNVIALDTETTGLSSLTDDIFSIQIGTGKDNYLIDLQDYSTSLFERDVIKIKEVFPYLLNKTLVGHNIAFDIGFFYKHGYYPKNIEDTFVASKILHNGDLYIYSHSFGAVMERELNLVYDKSEQKNIHKVKLSTSTAIQYCFNDVDKLLTLFFNLENKLKKYGAYDSYRLNADYLKGLVYMERCGLALDKKLWLDKVESDKKLSKEIQQEIIQYIYDNLPKYRDNQLSLFDTDKKIILKLSSVKQMIPVFKDLGINVLNDEKKESIDAKVINKSNHEFSELWLKYKKVEHDVTTFGENILEQMIEGRIYTRFNPIVDTCRISSRKGEINFLNFPSNEKTRKCFVAKPKHKMIVCDYDNQEMKCLCNLSKDPVIADNVLNNRDSHAIFARLAFPEISDLSDTEIKEKHKDKRQVGKIVGFTASFGGQGYTISKNLNLPVSEGERLYETYKSLYSQVFVWGEETLQKAIKVGYIESAYGFKLKLPDFDKFTKLDNLIKEKTNEFWESYKAGKLEYKAYLANKEAREKDSTIPVYEIKDKGAFKFYMSEKDEISSFFRLKSLYMRLCLNFPCQSTAAHQTKLSVVNLFNYILSRNHIGKVLITNVVHDEIVLEVIDELVEEYTEMLGKIMVDSANVFVEGGLVKMSAEAHSGSSWYEAK